MGAEGLICAFCCVLFVPFVFQTVGFFTPMWASNATCDSIGLVYSCCTGDENDTCKNTNGGDELDARSLGLHATSFAVMFLAMFCLCCGICCCDDDGETGLCTALGGCCTLLFPVAGLFSLIGCIIVATQFSTSELGYSFYLCLTAGCLIILLTILGCLVVCNYGENEDRYPTRRQSTVCPSNGYDGNNPAQRSSAKYPSHGNEGDNPAKRSSVEYPSNDDYPAGRSVTVYPCNGYGDDSPTHRSRSISPSGGYGSASRQPSFSGGGASSVVLYSGSEGIAAYEPPQAQYEGQHDTMHAAAVVYEENHGGMFDVLKLDARSLGLPATSFLVMCLAMFCLCCGICCCDDDDETGLCTVLGYGDNSPTDCSRSIATSGGYGSASRQPSFSGGGASSVF